MADETVTIRLRLLGGTETAAEAKAVRGEIIGVGAATEEASLLSGRAGGRIGRTVGRLRGLWSGVRKAARWGAMGVVAAGALVAAWGKKAVTSTIDFAKSTLLLSKNFGLSTRAASEWAAVARVRGLDTKKLGMAFKTLSTQVVGARDAAGSGRDMFAKLGISQRELQAGAKDISPLMGKVADGLNKLGPGADRGAIAGKLLGRGWSDLIPVLRDGSKGLQEQLDMANKYGATLGGKPLRSMEDLIAAQREMQFAQLGLQIAFTEQVVPSLIKVFRWVAKMVNQFRKGKGPIHNVVTVMGQFGGVALMVIGFLAQHKTLLGAVVAGYIAFKTAVKVAAAYQWAMNIAAEANPYIAIATAVAIAAYLIVTHWKQVKQAFRDAWRWIKDHPYIALLFPMVGQIAFVVVLIIKHWKQLKGAAVDTWQWISNAFGNVVRFFKKLPGRIGEALKDVGRVLVAPFKWAWQKIKGLADKISHPFDTGGGGGVDVPGIGHVSIPSPGGFLPRFAGGVRNFRGGVALVGERGPELARLPRGTSVSTNRDSRRAILDATGLRTLRREVVVPVTLELDGQAIAHKTVREQETAEARA